MGVNLFFLHYHSMKTTKTSSDRAVTDSEWTYSPSFKVNRGAKAIKVGSGLNRSRVAETEI